MCIDRFQEKEKARKRYEQKENKKKKWERTLRQENGYSVRSVEYQEYGDLVFEWLKVQCHFYETRSLCSCSMCGNARRHFGFLSLQEKKFLLEMKDQIEDLEEGLYSVKV